MIWCHYTAAYTGYTGSVSSWWPSSNTAAQGGWLGSSEVIVYSMGGANTTHATFEAKRPPVFLCRSMDDCAMNLFAHYKLFTGWCDLQLVHVYHTAIQSINGLLLKGFIKVQQAFQGPGINGLLIVQIRVRWMDGINLKKCSFHKARAVSIVFPINTTTSNQIPKQIHQNVIHGRHQKSHTGPAAEMKWMWDCWVSMRREGWKEGYVQHYINMRDTQVSMPCRERLSVYCELLQLKQIFRSNFRPVRRGAGQC